MMDAAYAGMNSVLLRLFLRGLPVRDHLDILIREEARAVVTAEVTLGVEIRNNRRGVTVRAGDTIGHFGVLRQRWGDPLFHFEFGQPHEMLAGETVVWGIEGIGRWLIREHPCVSRMQARCVATGQASATGVHDQCRIEPLAGRACALPKRGFVDVRGDARPFSGDEIEETWCRGRDDL